MSRSCPLMCTHMSMLLSMPQSVRMPMHLPEHKPPHMPEHMSIGDVGLLKRMSGVYTYASAFTPDYAAPEIKWNQKACI